MKKKFLIVLTFLVVAALAFATFACSDYVEPDDGNEDIDTVSRTQIVTNGTFYDAKASTKGDYIKNTVSGWTAAKGSLNYTENGVACGVVDLSDEKAFDLNKDKLYTDGEIEKPDVDPSTPFDTDDDGKPTDELQDNNALVISAKDKAGSVFYKNSSSFSLEANSYYLLQYSVCTFIDMTDVEKSDEAKKGAWVMVRGGIEYVDACINTNGKWETHYLYIETNKHEKISLDIRLWLGSGPEKINGELNPYTTKGAVFFDNIICTKVTTAKDPVYNDNNETTLNHDVFSSMAAQAISANGKIGYESAYYMTDLKLEQTTEITPTTTNAQNMYYSFREGSYSGANINNFNAIAGKSDLGSANAPETNFGHLGIVDFAKLYEVGQQPDKDTGKIESKYKTLLGKQNSTQGSKFIDPGYEQWNTQIMNGVRDISLLDETKALLIMHGDLSGYGFKSKKSLVIEASKNYVIKVWAYVWAPVDDTGKVKFPEFSPTESDLSKIPEYTEAQKRLVGYYNEDPKGLFPAKMSFADYIKELSKEESDLIKESAPVASTADIIKLAEDEELLSSLKAIHGDIDALKSSFVWLYIYENYDSFVTAGKLSDEQADKDFVNYQYLVERKTFLDKTWKDTKDLIDRNNRYNNAFADYMLKYNVWGDRMPFATVKLTGAGADLEKNTVKCNEGWEEITFYVQGNKLSNRNLTLEFWFGEGSANDYDTLMYGGVLFDNVTIEEVDRASYEHEEWNELSPLSDIGELDFGGLIEGADFDARWKYELSDETVMSSSDIDNIELKLKDEEDLVSVDFGEGGVIALKEMVYTHKEPTASVLESLPGSNHEYDIEILPNKSYRFAIRVKTEGFEKGTGVTISLVGGTADEKKKDTLTSVSAYNSEEWQELVFYILGDTKHTNYVGLKLQLGEGTRFDTAKYVKGSVHLAVANCTEIKYSEFNASTKSGDKIETYTFKNTIILDSTADSVSNGNFANIDYSTTTDKDFNEDGSLKNPVKPADWSVASAVNNTYNAVVLKVEHTGDPDANDGVAQDVYKLTWDAVSGYSYEGNTVFASSYEIYVRYLEGVGADAKYVEKLYATVDSEDYDKEYAVANIEKFEFNIDMETYKSCAVRVRGVSDEAIGTYSSYSTIGQSATGDQLTTEDADGKKELVYGTVSSKGLFTDTDPEVYRSPYNSVLKISSNYLVAQKLTSNTFSTSANSYYRVSVWVMTEGDAFASVTISNPSNVLSTDVDKNYIGYSNIKTDGVWKQYCFYIKTGSTNNSASIELGLGNSYAQKSTVTTVPDPTDPNKTKSISGTSRYQNSDLSMGTVYFDTIRVYSIDEEEYEREVNEIGEYNEDGSPKFRNFKYIYEKSEYTVRSLEYTIDSFDSFTEYTSTSETEKNLGNTPKSYKQGKSADATGTSVKERMYGVYNINMDLNKLESLYTITENDEVINVFKEFMPEDFDIVDFIHIDGNNSLVLSNKVAYAQNYTASDSSKINSKSYYKLTFKAKTLIAKIVEDSDGNKTYVTDGVNAEFRFMQNSSTEKYQSILINSYEEKEYTLYIYNPSASESSAKWAFYLGDNKNDEDKTGTKQLLIGMMVIDQVSLSSVTQDDYEAALAEYDLLSDDEKTKAAVRVYSYDEDKKTENDDHDHDTDEEEKPEKPSVWDRGDVWLLVSSLVLAVLIIIVVVVVLVKRWKKLHPKEVVGENVAKTEKDIKVIEPVSTGKEDIVENEEYSDRMPVEYNQRVVNKGKKKKKK